MSFDFNILSDLLFTVPLIGLQYTNMSAFNRALLRSDVSREQRGELQMRKSYDEQKAEEQRTDSEWGIIGSVVGAIIGFSVGGFGGAMAGWGVGGTGAAIARYKGAGPDQFDEEEYLKNNPFSSGGKFNRFADVGIIKSELDTLKDDKLAEELDIALSLVTSAMSVSTGIQKGALPSKGYISSKQWRDLPFLKKIGLFTEELTATQLSGLFERYNNMSEVASVSSGWMDFDPDWKPDMPSFDEMIPSRPNVFQQAFENLSGISESGVRDITNLGQITKNAFKSSPLWDENIFNKLREDIISKSDTKGILDTKIIPELSKNLEIVETYGNNPDLSKINQVNNPDSLINRIQSVPDYMKNMEIGNYPEAIGPPLPTEKTGWHPFNPEWRREQGKFLYEDVWDRSLYANLGAGKKAPADELTLGQQMGFTLITPEEERLMDERYDLMLNETFDETVVRFEKEVIDENIKIQASLDAVKANPLTSTVLPTEAVLPTEFDTTYVDTGKLISDVPIKPVNLYTLDDISRAKQYISMDWMPDSTINKEAYEMLRGPYIDRYSGLWKGQ